MNYRPYGSRVMNLRGINRHGQVDADVSQLAMYLGNQLHVPWIDKVFMAPPLTTVEKHTIMQQSVADPDI